MERRFTLRHGQRQPRDRHQPLYDRTDVRTAVKEFFITSHAPDAQKGHQVFFVNGYNKHRYRSQPRRPDSRIGGEIMTSKRTFPHFLLFSLLLLSIMFALPNSSASADMGPKESVTILVTNAPNKPYYIDLLYMPEDPKGFAFQSPRA